MKQTESTNVQTKSQAECISSEFEGSSVRNRKNFCSSVIHVSRLVFCQVLLRLVAPSRLYLNCGRN